MENTAAAAAKLSEVSDTVDANPPKTTGIDGKAYPQTRSARKPPRRALADDALTLSSELRKLNSKFQKLLDDDRFDRNREAIANQLRPQAAIGIVLLTRLTAVDIQSSTAGVA